MLFVEEGANVCGATLNVKNGPIYIGKNAEVMEGACLERADRAVRESKSTNGGKNIWRLHIRPYCKVGGEIDNSVLFGYSNKAHDGYGCNAVVGEWCNIGAGVNALQLEERLHKIRYGIITPTHSCAPTFSFAGSSWATTQN